MSRETKILVAIRTWEARQESEMVVLCYEISYRSCIQVNSLVPCELLRGLLKSVGYNPCSVPAVSVSVFGYRRVNEYTGTGLRRAGHVFFGKNPLYPYPFTCRSPPVPVPAKFKFPSWFTSNQYPYPPNPLYPSGGKKSRTRTRVPPYPWYPCTRDGHRYETGRVRFWKKKPIYPPCPCPPPAAGVPGPYPRYPPANH
jgi:hypothetical protein